MKIIIVFFCMIFSIFFSPLYSSMGAKDVKQKREDAVSTQDAEKIKEFETLLKKHLAVLKSKGFPWGESHAQYNKELPLVFAQLKQLYDGLSVEAKDIVGSNKVLITTIDVIKRFMNKMIVRHRDNIVKQKAHNLSIQLDLQAPMLQWYWSKLSAKNKDAIDIQKTLQQFSALRKTKEEYEENSFAKGMGALWKKENTKNPLFHLEFARQIFHDTTDEFPPALAYQPNNTFADAADAAQAPYVSCKNEPEMHTKLVQGDKYTSEVISWFEKHPEALWRQDEHGWTPYMQAAAQGHQETLNAFMQIFIDIFFVNAASYYRKFYEIPNPARDEDFLCVIDPLDKSQCIEAVRLIPNQVWSRHYVVQSDCYRSFVCSLIDIKIKKEDAEQTLAKLRTEGKIVLVGLKAYIFAKCMEVKSKTYPTISAIDSAQEYNQFIAQCKEHREKLKGAFDQALDKPSCVGAAGVSASAGVQKPMGIPLKPIRDIVSSYLETDIPNPTVIKAGKDEGNCCIQ